MNLDHSERRNTHEIQLQIVSPGDVVEEKVGVGKVHVVIAIVRHAKRAIPERSFELRVDEAKVSARTACSESGNW